MRHGKKEANQRGEELQVLPAASEGPQEWPKPNVLSPTTYMGPYGDVFHKNEKKYAKKICELHGSGINFISFYRTFSIQKTQK